MPLNREDVERYTYEVGKFVVAWASLEWGLNAWVSVVFSHYPYDGRNNRYPKPLSLRVEFLQQSYSSNAKLSQYKTEALDWLLSINRMKDERNFIMKGIVSIQESDPKRFILKRIDAKGNDADLNAKPVSLDRLKNIRRESFAIGRAIIGHVQTIFPDSGAK